MTSTIMRYLPLETTQTNKKNSAAKNTTLLTIKN